MKILVLGAGGMAGHMVTTYLREKGLDVSAVSASRKLDHETILIDAMDYKVLGQFLNGNAFDIVINCIGVLVEESNKRKKEAVMLNAFLPHFLEDCYKNTKTRVIHLSTDCVFSGYNGPYHLDEEPDSTSFYGRTKALGEIVNAKDLTMRMSIIGPEIKKEGVGLFNWFMQQQGVIRGYSRVYWNGITTLELAKIIERVINEPLSGRYHFSMNKPISKYELLELFKKYIPRERLSIKKNGEKVSNKVLMPSLLDQLDSTKAYSEMIDEMMEWIRNHPALYPHYQIV